MKQSKKVKLRLGLVTGITVSYLIVSTLLSSTLILTNWKNAQIANQGQNEELKQQIIAKNIEISEADEGVLPELIMPEEPTTITAGEENVQALEGGVDTSKWDLSRVNKVYDTAGVPVPVPKGFTASGAAGEHTVNSGFVIYEGTGAVTDSNAWDESINRNQFVWVPVKDIDRIYKIDGTIKKKGRLWEYNSEGRTEINDPFKAYEPYDFVAWTYYIIFNKHDLSGYRTENFNKDLNSEYLKTLDSIEKYGGFYIGRYETGELTTQKPVVKRMSTTLGSDKWLNYYLRMKNISDNSNIQTNMIWGSLWDETLQWLIDTGAKTQYEIGKDSNSWGNFYNNEITYLDTDGTYKTKKSTDWSVLIPAGSSEYTNANNIYDLTGNAYDWTLERVRNGPSMRGDSRMNINAYAANRSSPGIEGKYKDYGARAYFYIK